MSLEPGRLAGLAAAALVAGAGLVGVSTVPASAAVCHGQGLTAVVDYNDGAGGGTQSACAATAGPRKARSVFEAVGVQMKHNPDGSVCQVNGEPKAATCRGLGSQYWGLWWSDGTDGSWTYSQRGADTLTVPRNGSVAWAWQGASGRRQPGVAPPVVTGAPAPTKTPAKTQTKAPTKKAGTGSGGTGGGSSTGGSAGAGGTAATAPTAPTSTAGTSGAPRPQRSATRTPSVSNSSTAASESPAAPETLEPTDTAPGATSREQVSGRLAPEQDENGLPAWVPIGVLAGLAAAVGGALWWRRRTGAV